MSKNSGKLTLENCNTPQEESNTLRKRAIKLVKQRNKYEREHPQVAIRVDARTYKLVDKSNICEPSK